MKARIAVFIAIVQTILFAGHLLVYETWMHFWPPSGVVGRRTLALSLVALSLSFVSATLLAHRYFNSFVRTFYRIAGTWLGVLNFAFLASVGAWATYFAMMALPVSANQHAIGAFWFGVALLASLYGILNAALLRVKRVKVKLPGLPSAWKGRVAALVTDTHLGHVRGQRFVSRIVHVLRQLRPDAVFIAGDMFDGTKVDPSRLAAPWKQLTPKFGTYFVTGNHEEFEDPGKYLDGVKQSGIRVLDGEKVDVEGLQIVGVPYHESANPERFHSALKNAELDRSRASILLSHVPQGLPIAEKHGISLQLSGHTHGGQMFPFTWLTSRIFGKHTYGLSQHGQMSVFTSYGAGTWGPPMRVGTWPEIVLIQFE